MSTVNYVEVLILLSQTASRRLSREVRDLIDSSDIGLCHRRRQGEIAAEARLRFPLNMEDRLAL